MKLSLVTKVEGWYSNEIRKSCQKYGVDFERVEIKDLNNIENLKTLGEVVFWRDAEIYNGFGRNTFFNLTKDKFVINSGVGVFPFVTHKYFQQKYLEEHSSVKTIPTYIFNRREDLAKAIETGILSFPFIQKPNLGSKGEDISLVEKMDDIADNDELIKRYVYQNFIKNLGDYRIFMVGGKALGVMKRIAKEGSFLNNVSQGGTTQHITDPDLVTKLAGIAAKISSCFELAVCGIDLIFNEEDKNFYFLELNTAPQWKGFQKTTGVVVADEIVRFSKSVSERLSKDLYKLVRENYEDNFEYLREKKFHFSSRRYLWNSDVNAKNFLDAFKSQYLGSNEKELVKKIDKRISQGFGNDLSITNISSRKVFFEKYPFLYPYQKVLFFSLFAEKIYGMDIRNLIGEKISDEDFISLKNLLTQDREAISILSTFAINFFYLLEEYLEGKGVSSSDFINPSFYYDIGLNCYTGKKDAINLQLYLFTHCIIGESRFYARSIVRYKDTYMKMISRMENIIKNNYFEISLDNKFEFLVSSKLCSHKSFLESLIVDEAKSSLSPIGNFIVDTVNRKLSFGKSDFVSSEHRNVLLLMANEEFRLEQQ